MKQKLFTLLTLLCMITVAWAGTTAPTGGPHTPGTITNLVISGGREYEVFFSNNASTSSLLVGSNTSATTEATSTTSWCNIGSSCGNTSNSISTAFTLDEFVSNVKTSDHKAIRVQSLGVDNKNVVMVIKGYDGIATLDKDEVQVYAEIYNEGTSTYGDQSKLDAAGDKKTASSHNKRYYNLDASKQYRLTIAYGTSGSTNKTLVGFSLRLPAFTTTIGATGWSTFSSNKALDFAHATPSDPASADLKAYMITGASGTSITKSAALNDAPGSTGLLINGTAGETYSIPVLASSATSTTGNLMKPCVTATTVNHNDNDGWNYVLVNNSGTPEFQKIVSGTYSSANVSAGKAYLALTSDPGSRALSLFDDEATGVASVEKTQTTTNQEVYNLAGQRVAQPSKGLYIVNGKKVVIK